MSGRSALTMKVVIATMITVLLVHHIMKHINREEHEIPVKNEKEPRNPATPELPVLLRSNKRIKYNHDQYGELAFPSNISEHLRELIKEGYDKNQYNQYAADLMSLHRSLPDARHISCKKKRYPLSLPQTSVIICFYNKAWSVLLRTVHSVLNRSPPHLLKEIILVDDYSDLALLKTQLVEYWAPYPKVKMLRTERREGLIRAKLLGAKYAKGPVLTFLDAHCECSPGWLEPPLFRIMQNSSHVVTPIIDEINKPDMKYKSKPSHIGGFGWRLRFYFYEVPKRLKNKMKTPIDPIPSPTMAGGLFSIERNYFYKLGTYDSGFDLWGAENLELSFKIWMCGGTLEVIPCSHVGHIFREHSPYIWSNKTTVDTILRRNSLRLALVWMDEYADFFLEAYNYNMEDYGDISSRLELRKNLSCKSFKWYLDNIFPEHDFPTARLGSGSVGNAWSSMCLDSKNNIEDKAKPLEVWPCHNEAGNQYWVLTKEGEVKREWECMDYTGESVVLFTCHGLKRNQEWLYDHDNQELKQALYKKCLAITDDRRSLTLEECDLSDPRQRWRFQNYNEGFDKAWSPREQQ